MAPSENNIWVEGNLSLVGWILYEMVKAWVWVWGWGQGQGSGSVVQLGEESGRKKVKRVKG